MKILIDASSINKKNILASVPNYILRLIDAFLTNKTHDIALLIDSDFQSFFGKKYPFTPKHLVKRNYFLYRLPIIGEIYAQWCYRNATRQLNYDAEIIASDLDRGTKTKIKCKRIQIIHDLKAIKDGCFYQKLKNKKFYQYILLNSDSIVAISEFTKQDIINYFKVDEKKITVIPNSIVLAEAKENIKLGIPEKFILYVNTLSPHKNPITLIKAYETIQNQINHKIIFVGKKTSYWEKIILPYIQKHNLQNKIVHLQNLKFEELQYLYQKASLFVTTSKREGFGYTPIEAALNKVPVISSTSEALPYSTQGMLNYYFPADDYKNLAQKIIDVLSTPPNKRQLETIAKKFSIDYSPKVQIEKFNKLIQSMDVK